MPDLFMNIGGVYKELDKAFVNIGGAWREVDKMWVNINGTWREVSISSFLKYIGLAPPLNGAKYGHTGDTTNNYIIFSTGVSGTIDAYNVSLVKSTVDAGYGNNYMWRTSQTIDFGSRIMFMGGLGGIYGEETSIVDIYTEALVKGQSNTSFAACNLGSAMVGLYCVVGGGHRYSGDSGENKSVNSFHYQNLTRGNLSDLVAGWRTCGVSIGSNAIMATHYGSLALRIESYNSSLVKSSVLYSGTKQTIGDKSAKTLNHALIPEANVTTHAFNTSLVRTTTSAVGVVNESTIEGVAALSLGKCAMFAGGGFGQTTGLHSAMVEVFDENLVKSVMESLSVPRFDPACGKIGNKVLVSGGMNGSTVHSSVDVYEYNE